MKRLLGNDSKLFQNLTRILQLQILQGRALQKESQSSESNPPRDIVIATVEVLSQLISSIAHDRTALVGFCNCHSQMLGYLTRFWAQSLSHNSDCDTLNAPLITLFKSLFCLFTRDILGSKSLSLAPCLIHILFPAPSLLPSQDPQSVSMRLSTYQLLQDLLRSDLNNRVVGNSLECLQKLSNVLLKSPENDSVSLCAQSDSRSLSVTSDATDAEDLSIADIHEEYDDIYDRERRNRCFKPHVSDVITLQALHVIWSVSIDDHNKIALLNVALALVPKLIQILRSECDSPYEETTRVCLAILAELASSRRAVTVILQSVFESNSEESLQSSTGDKVVAGLLQVLFIYCKPNVMEWTIDFIAIACGILHVVNGRNDDSSYPEVKTFMVAQAFTPGLPTETGTGFFPKLIHGLTEHKNDGVLELSCCLLMQLCVLLSRCPIANSQQSHLSHWLHQQRHTPATLKSLVVALLSDKGMHSVIAETNRVHCLATLQVIIPLIDENQIEQLLGMTTTTGAADTSDDYHYSGKHMQKKRGRPRKNPMSVTSMMLDSLLKAWVEELQTLSYEQTQQESEGSQSHGDVIALLIDVVAGLAKGCKHRFVRVMNQNTRLSERFTQCLVQSFQLTLHRSVAALNEVEELVGSNDIENIQLKLLTLMKMILPQRLSILPTWLPMVSEAVGTKIAPLSISVQIECLLLIGNVVKWDLLFSMNSAVDIKSKSSYTFGELLHSVVKSLIEGIIVAIKGNTANHRHSLVSLLTMLKVLLSITELQDDHSIDYSSRTKDQSLILLQPTKNVDARKSVIKEVLKLIVTTDLFPIISTLSPTVNDTEMTEMLDILVSIFQHVDNHICSTDTSMQLMKHLSGLHKLFYNDSVVADVVIDSDPTTIVFALKIQLIALKLSLKSSYESPLPMTLDATLNQIVIKVCTVFFTVSPTMSLQWQELIVSMWCDAVCSPSITPTLVTLILTMQALTDCTRAAMNKDASSLAMMEYVYMLLKALHHQLLHLHIDSDGNDMSDEALLLLTQTLTSVVRGLVSSLSELTMGLETESVTDMMIGDREVDDLRMDELESLLDSIQTILQPMVETIATADKDLSNVLNDELATQDSNNESLKGNRANVSVMEIDRDMIIEQSCVSLDNVEVEKDRQDFGDIAIVSIPTVHDNAVLIEPNTTIEDIEVTITLTDNMSMETSPSPAITRSVTATTVSPEETALSTPFTTPVAMTPCVSSMIVTPVTHDEVHYPEVLLSCQSWSPITIALSPSNLPDPLSICTNMRKYSPLFVPIPLDDEESETRKRLRICSPD